MNYRELQKALKAKGLNAKGSKAELEARWDDAVTITVEVNSDYREFVYTGDPNAPGTDPEYSSMYGYLWKLNGRAITVKPEHAIRLATNTHFTEA
jgi:hypothetical protein